MNRSQTIIYTGLALVAFAGNSILCRLALGSEAIDAASFTVIRLLSGAVVLGLILLFNKQRVEAASKGSWSAALMLFVYAVTFSFAYLSMDTGTGALILFGVVQVTIILAGVVAGNKLQLSELVGVLIAFLGLTYLVLPGLATPSVVGFVLMAVAGVAWGIYTLLGKGSLNPLADTAYNFIRTVPMAMVVLIFAFQSTELSTQGVALAVASGALASGLGYTIWYAALAGLGGVQSAVLQLLVPVIAALGGVVFVGEILSLRLVISAALILSGILWVIFAQRIVARS